MLAIARLGSKVPSPMDVENKHASQIREIYQGDSNANPKDPVQRGSAKAEPGPQDEYFNSAVRSLKESADNAERSPFGKGDMVWLILENKGGKRVRGRTAVWRWNMGAL